MKLSRTANAYLKDGRTEGRGDIQEETMKGRKEVVGKMQQDETNEGMKGNKNRKEGGRARRKAQTNKWRDKRRKATTYTSAL
jgi:hypothetical protein